MAKDLVSLATSPFAWHHDDWENFGLCLMAGSSFFPVDNSIHRWMKDIQESSPRLIKAGRFFSAAGSPLILLSFMSGGYLAGELAGSSKTRQTFLLAGESLLLTEIYVQLLKTALGRARPYNEEGPFHFHPLNFKDRWNSLPSGHAAAAWAIASSISSTTDSCWLSGSAIILASAVSLSRIILDKHYASDVVFGSLLGYFIGRKIASSGTQKESLKYGQVSFQPHVGPGFIAISINFGLK